MRDRLVYMSAQGDDLELIMRLRHLLDLVVIMVLLTGLQAILAGIIAVRNSASLFSFCLSSACFACSASKQACSAVQVKLPCHALSAAIGAG